MRTILQSPFVSPVFLLATLWIPTSSAQHTLRVTPSTVQWGYFASDGKPVLTVKPGELVTMDTICAIDELEQLGAAPDDPIRELKEVEARVKDKGPGPHVLTGPVAIEGAMPGDVLEVEIVDIRLRSPYGWMQIAPDAGTLPEEFPYLRSKLVPLDDQNKVALFAPGIRIPVHPFFGVLGVAPPEGRLSSGPPAYNGGNMDNKWLVAGTKVYLPVQVPGALFLASGYLGELGSEIGSTASSALSCQTGWKGNGEQVRCDATSRPQGRCADACRNRQRRCEQLHDSRLVASRRA
jgi:hypothetical protein